MAENEEQSSTASEANSAAGIAKPTPPPNQFVRDDPSGAVLLGVLAGLAGLAFLYLFAEGLA